MKDNPAPWISSVGDICYLTDDHKYHRTDGPAFESTRGYKAWYIDGVYHREDGPAIEYADGRYAWWYKGKQVFVSNLKEFQSYIRNKAFW